MNLAGARRLSQQSYSVRYPVSVWHVDSPGKELLTCDRSPIGGTRKQLWERKASRLENSAILAFHGRMEARLTPAILLRRDHK